MWNLSSSVSKLDLKSDLTVTPTRAQVQSEVLKDMESRMEHMSAVCDIAQKTIQYLDNDLSQRLSELIATTKRSLEILNDSACIYPNQGIIGTKAARDQSPPQHEFSSRITVIHNWAECGHRWVHNAQISLHAWLGDQQVQVRRLEKREMDLREGHFDLQKANFDIDVLLNAFEDISIDTEQELRLPKVCKGEPVGIDHSTQIQIQDFPYFYHDVNEYQTWPEDERRLGWSAHTLYINLYDLALRSGLL